MKKLLQVSMMIVLLATAHDSFSQFNKGRFIAGGSVRFMSSSNESLFAGSTTESKSSSFGFSPSVGYFFFDNVAVGASVGLTTSKQKIESLNVESTNTSATIGPFVRYYLPKPIFFQASAMFGSSKFKTISPTEQEVKRGLTQLGLAVGYAYMFNNFVALEPMLGYQSFTNKEKNSDNKAVDGSFYLSCAFTVYLGERN